MNSTRRTRFVAAALGALVWLCAAPASVSAADADTQPDKAAAPHDAEWVKAKTQTCQACHGAQGVSQAATFPTLAGQYESYLLHALRGYRDGTRQNAIMAGQAAAMTDPQLEALAQYYSRQPSPLSTPDE